MCKVLLLSSWFVCVLIFSGHDKNCIYFSLDVYVCCSNGNNRLVDIHVVLIETAV